MEMRVPDLGTDIAPAVRVTEHALDKNLLGLYLYGSAVTGGWHHDSDIDLLAVVERSLGDEVRKSLADSLLRVSGRWPRSGPARPVELTVVVRGDLVPWRYPPRSDFVYGEWLRPEFERGDLAAPAEDPDLTILVTMARDCAMTLAGPPAARILDPVPAGDVLRAVTAGLPDLIAGADGDERNAVLTLARMWVTAETGAVVSKAEAAAAVLPRLPAEHAAVLRLARAGYLGEVADSWADRRAELNSFLRYAGERIAVACAARGYFAARRPAARDGQPEHR
ncbi:aminoglycoside adenylyltransferase family protein [Nocardia carnea]|uniref:aminoglycoside adenylyltransferase family protein n=1 Tax=Nocardia carnea TaxID=37328 RepID=UPI00245623D2|nr:aminoglycoside adenylyltransferase family protein [Nocardia carnea]